MYVQWLAISIKSIAFTGPRSIVFGNEERIIAFFVIYYEGAV